MEEFHKNNKKKFNKIKTIYAITIQGHYNFWEKYREYKHEDRKFKKNIQYKVKHINPSASITHLKPEEAAPLYVGFSSIFS